MVMVVVVQLVFGSSMAVVIRAIVGLPRLFFRATMVVVVGAIVGLLLLVVTS